jgi:hypothetical protein
MSDYDPSLDPPEDGYQHPDAMPSRAAIALDIERRAAAEESKKAAADARRSMLDRGRWSLGKTGTQAGRELEILMTYGGAVIFTYGGLLGLIAAFETIDDAAKLADLIETALAGSPTPRVIVGRCPAVDKTLQVERVWEGIVVRDAALEGHSGVLCALNSVQALRLVAAIRRGLPK